MRKFTNKTMAGIGFGAVLVVGTGIAYAASLGVSSDILGGGSDTVDSNCEIQASYVTVPGDAQTADVTWHDATEAEPAGYYLDTVTLTSTGGDCVGATYRLTVAGTDDVKLEEVTGTLVGTGTEKVNPADVLVDDVTGLFAVITKAATNPA